MAVQNLILAPHLLICFSLPLRPWNPRFRLQNPNYPPNSRLKTLIVRCSSSSGGPYRYSNAESVRSGKFGFQEKRSWWSDESEDSEEEEEDEEVEDESEIYDDEPEKLWEKFWILKVFKSYGWFLPPILISMILANGLDAFLLALAIPLGQSAISIAVEKVWKKARGDRKSKPKPKPKPKTKKRPFARTYKNVERKQEEKGECRGNGNGNGNGNGRPVYQSWVASEDSVAEKRSDQRQSSFGGWDELDRRGGSSDEGATRRSPRTAGGPTRQQSDKGKLSRVVRNRDVPLLVRLLVAVFPFLGSWTNML